MVIQDISAARLYKEGYFNYIEYTQSDAILGDSRPREFSYGCSHESSHESWHEISPNEISLKIYSTLYDIVQSHTTINVT